MFVVQNFKLSLLLSGADQREQETQNQQQIGHLWHLQRPSEVTLHDPEGFGDLDLKKGVEHDLKLEKGQVWNKI